MKIRLASVSLALSFVLLAGSGVAAQTADANVRIPASSSAQTEKPTGWLDTKTPLQWLRNKEFDRLDKHLEALYQEVKAKPENEYRLVWTYSVLNDSYQDTAPAIAAWRAERPQSHAARIIEASQTINRTWDIRGTGTARSVTEERFKRFHAGLDQAAQMLSPVLEQVPDHPAAWNYYVTTQCAHNTGACPGEIITMLDENAPRAYFPRRRLMNFIQPKWGGSIEAIQAYQAHLEPAMADNPHWGPLRGFDELIICEAAGRAREFDIALPACEKAWPFGPDPLFLESISVAYIAADQFKQLEKYTDELKQRFPSNGYDKSLDGIALNVSMRGRYLFTHGKSASAIEAYDIATAISSREPMPYMERAKMYLEQKKHNEAEMELRRLVNANPDYYFGYEKLTEVIQQRRMGMYKEYRDSDADLIPLWLRYIERHPDDAMAHSRLAGIYSNIYHEKGEEGSQRHMRIACEKGDDSACKWLESLQKK